MYKSPIEIIHGQMQTAIENEIYKAVASVNVVVDKEELLKALTYDRNMYEKGYKDGFEAGLYEAGGQHEID